MTIPSEGDTFNGKRVTNSYAVDENSIFQMDAPDMPSSQNCPWNDIRKNVKSVEVIDNNIHPISIRMWFAGFTNMNSCNLTKLDARKLIYANESFFQCHSLKQINLSSWKTNSLEIMNGAFCDCSSLESIDLIGLDTSGLHGTLDGIFAACFNIKNIKGLEKFDVHNVSNFNHFFENCHNLTIDLSDWNVNPDTSHINFNLNAAGATLPKPWQAGSFAIYSNDDNSLDFYHKENIELSDIGNTYNGKTVTNVYFDFEENNPAIDKSSEHIYKYGYFHDLENKVTSINVIDSGISPTSISGWFSDFRKLENVNGFQKIDMSRCTDAHYLFTFDSNLTRIDLSNWKCPVLNDIGGMFE